MNDVRYALRRLQLAPALSITIVVTLALGIGANAAVFSLADKLFLEPPPRIAHPESLRRIYTRSNWSVGGLTEIHDEMGYPQFTAVASALGGHAQLTAYTKPDSVVVGDDEVRTTAQGSYVDSAFFRALGVRTARGRTFAADEESFGNPSMVAVISYSYWQGHFHGAANIVGTTELFDRQRYSIIGVTERGFRGADLGRTDVWLPLASPYGDTTRPWYQSWRNARRVRAIARLAPGTTNALLGEVATAGFRNGEIEHVTRGPDTATVISGPILESLGPSIGQRTEVAILLRLMGVGLALLLVACANAANLLLARALARQREIAVRLALGVSRARLVSQLFIESVTLSLVAGAAAIVAAAWCRALLARLILPGVDVLDDQLEWRMVAVTLAITLVTGVLAGLAPALHAGRSDIAGALRGGARHLSGAATRLRPMLVVVQTALSLLLLVGAGLFAHSLQDLRSTDVGYDVDHLLWGTVFFYDAQQHSTDRFGDFRADQISRGLQTAKMQLERVRGVEHVALSRSAPMAGYMMVTLFTDSGRAPRLDHRDPALIATTPEYFATTGVQLRRGRFFDESDDFGAPPVVVVNETAAKAYWPHREAVGQCLHWIKQDAPCWRVIGVVKDSHITKIIENPAAEVFVPAAQRSSAVPRVSYVIVRARPGEVEHVAEVMRRTLRAIFPTAEPPYVRIAASVLEPELRPWTLGTMLFTAFAVLASIVAAIGVYSAMAYAVTERTRELGIRIALGAANKAIIGLVVGTAARIVGVGVLVGIALVLISGKLVAAMLYATSPQDPVVILAASAALMLIGILASVVPAWRASRADPVSALRAE